MFVFVLWPISFRWLLVRGLYRGYEFSNMIPQLLWLVGIMGTRKPIEKHRLEGWSNYNWRSKSAWVIRFRGVFVLPLFFLFSVDIWAFVIVLNQISPFFSIRHRCSCTGSWTETLIFLENRCCKTSSSHKYRDTLAKRGHILFQLDCQLHVSVVKLFCKDNQS